MYKKYVLLFVNYLHIFNYLIREHFVCICRILQSKKIQVFNWFHLEIKNSTKLLRKNLKF